MNPSANPLMDDLDAMELTTRALGISHYQLFAEAYRAWHGRELEESDLNRLFGRYLNRSEIPSYVRHFARNFVIGHPEILAARLAEQRKRQRAEHLAYALIMLMVLAALFLF